MCITRILQKYSLQHVMQVMSQVKGFELFEILFYLIGIELLVINIFISNIFK